MPDLVTYSSAVTKLGPELLQKRPKYAKQSGNSVVFNVPKTPTKRSGNKTISLVRAKDDEVSLFDGITNVQVLGTIEEVLASPTKKAIYNQFYPEGSVTVNIYGTEVTVPNPQMPVFL